MDKTFENKLQNKLTEFEANVPNTTWDKVNHDLANPFETKLKGKLTSVNATVSAGAWAAIESSLPNSLENGLKDKLANHKAPVNAGIWSAISQQIESMPGVFEDAVQDKVLNYQASPSAGTMAAIFAQLDAKKIISWKKVITSAAAVLLLFTTLFLLPKNTGESDLRNYGNGLALYNSQVGNDKATNGEKANSYQSDDQIAGIFPGNELKTGGASSNSKNDGTTNNFSDGLNDENGKDIYNDNSGNDKGGFQNNSNGLANNAGGGKRNLIGLNEKMRNELGEIPFVESVDLKSGLPFTKSPSLASIVSDASTVIKTAEPTSNLVLSIASSNGSFKMNTVSNGILGAYDNDFESFNNEVNFAGSFNTLAANLAYGVSDRVHLLSGLQLTHARNDVSFSIKNNSDGSSSSFNSLVDNGIVNTSSFNPVSNQLRSKRESELEYENVDAAILDGDSIISGNEYTLGNRYLFVDIPVGFEVDLFNRNKSSLSARIGAKIRMIAGANSYHITSDRDKIVEVSSAMSQAFYQSSLVGFSGVQYQHQIGDNYEIFAGPEVNLNLTDINKLGTWMSMRPFQLGINIGIRQKIS